MDKARAADVVPVIRGKWYIAEWNPADTTKAKSFYCDKCHCVESFMSHFCPNCGAKMENSKYIPRTLESISKNYPFGWSSEPYENIDTDE